MINIIHKMLFNYIMLKSFCLNCKHVLIAQKQFRYIGIMVPILFNRSAKNWGVMMDSFSVLYSIDAKNKSPHSESDKVKKPKKELKTYITLITDDNVKTITTIEEAKKISNRRNLNLINVSDFDPKSRRAVYQLMSGSSFISNDPAWSQSKKEQFIKGDKVLSFSSNISENDLFTKIKLMKKWLTKHLEVRVIISGDTQAGEKVYTIIEKEIGVDGRILQKRTKADIRFQIIPPKKKEE